MGAPSHRSSTMIEGINVTPLVDVVLVLLIAVMVTASYTVSQALPMNLPQAKSGESEAHPMAISVGEEGELFLDGEAVTRKQLQSGVRRRHEAGEKSALIAADAASRHRMVVAVIDLLRNEGITQFAINVAPEDLRQDR